MSRLDDQLREAFRREMPSADFTERVLKAAAAAPAPKRTWWEELLSLLSTPKVRLVAVGVAASLLIVLWATQSQRLRGPVAAKQELKAENVIPAPAPAPDNGVAVQTPDAAQPVNQDGVAVRPGRHPRTRNHQQVERPTEVAKSEGEIAKEQLMLALHIASASLNEAQRIVTAGD